MCFNRRLKIFIALLFLFIVTGCSTVIVPLPVTDADRFTIQSIVSVGTVGSMAVSADGRMIAWADKNLNLHDIVSGQQHLLSAESPDALCWSPDGSHLAAVTYTDGESHLYIYDRSGRSVYDQNLVGRVGRLQWPQSGQLTASVLGFKTYSFGTHISGQLLQWDVRWRSTEIPLFETTIKPTTAARLTGQLHKTFDFDLSPLGDEVLYTRLYAPPAFAATRHLVLRNLQTEKEKEIKLLPLLNGAGRLMADGESVILSDGMGQIRMLDMWDVRNHQEWPGNRFDYNALSGLRLTDNRLYLNSNLLVELPQENRAQFSLTGQFMLVMWNNHLYLLDGYPLEKSTRIDGVKMKKLQKLRRLRSRELIEPNEYRQARERLLQ